ncbi:NAD-glutamate dehydrogenase [Marinobacterium sedimentorum]|uniref:NAD-glutamate dehydrogenase n=1 Tax=Marinobacterium sedimentorum TaxID=2927804 RepID=UPI0020C718FE|nr:NAD-glutamate dehydrogenase [Marinobacterium sedimentorum]MCP8688886.1 NAD-glutamate dehydrogenase [Marinobacterium sedimentorum]
MPAGVQDLIANLHDSRQASLLQTLLAHYFQHQQQDEQQQPGQQLYGALMSLWQRLQQRRSGTIEVAVYNPDPARDQWHSDHSIIEILMDDMPFIVASSITELARLGIGIHQQAYPVLHLRRDADGRLLDFCASGDQGACSETLVRFEIDHQASAEQLLHIRQRLQRILEDVRCTVADWRPMLSQIDTAARACEQSPEPDRETVAFLRWLADENFLFVGFRYYDVEPGEDGCYQLRYRDGSGLGCFRDPVSESQRRIQLDRYLSELLESPQRLVLTKSTTRSTVQQDVHLDYVGIKNTDTAGRVIGEWRFFGLYSSKAYDTPLPQIPLIRQHVSRLLQSCGLPTDSHSYKALRHILFNYPRDEMLQASYAQLQETVTGMLDCVERRRLGLFLRPDTHGRFINVLLLVPRDQYHTQLRIRVQDILLQALKGHSAEFSVRLGEQPLALIEFSIHCQHARQVSYDVAQLTQQIRDAMETWHDKLHGALSDQLSEAQANRLFDRFAQRFPAAYRDDTPPRAAVADMRQLDRLDTELATQLEQTAPGSLRFKVLGRGRDITLSDVLPILEHLGVRVCSATPYQLAAASPHGDADEAFWIIDFRLACDTGLDLAPEPLRTQFQQTFSRTYYGQLEDDRFHQLILGAGLDYRQVLLLRAISKYLQQLGVPFSQHYIEQALFRNPPICRLLGQLFSARFAPGADASRDARQQSLVDAINAALDAVDNLDEDRILRHYLGVIQAMLRTNYYQTDGTRQDDGQGKGYLSFKLNTRALPFAPEPRPAFEIFVYAPWVEGVHLRAGPIARGGLRWSDRREDFRTEVLGLVKAQMVKNAVIVPVGAKGGFVPKQLPEGGDRNAVQAEVIRCYETFIRGLLDITDNRVGDAIVPPPQVVRHDGDDPYLVVAADKGTATFSDIANRISAEYGFWLGDAFASGGSNGYDHKKMGITARGAWESVKRLFREQNRNCQTNDFSVVGIGDMAGDVFGNGMLLSRHICLVAAFNHQHIFIDPTPDAASTWQERKRLFELPRSSWEDYDQSLISAGGGLYRRSAKHIDLSPEARAALGTDQTRFSPNELIRVILQAPVDLLWNGGIGTYVKASQETQTDVGDRSNDNLRVDASELRVKVIGEGGNLGLTQRARIEFARQGGLVNTDAIDNAGGVDSSDHEVNLKILLSRELAQGALDDDSRNQLLGSMTDEVAALVLRHNFQQSQILSLCDAQAPTRINDHRRLMQQLEKAGRLNRELEYLPGDEQLDELARNGQGLTRPEIAVLLAYSKLWLCDQLIAQGIGQDPDLGLELPGYFPHPVRQHYGEQLQQHPLRSELLATHVTNQTCNRMGDTFVSYLQAETHCTALNAVRALVAARRILDIDSLWQALETLENSLDDSLFRDLLAQIQDLLDRTTLWLLRRNAGLIAIADCTSAYDSQVTGLMAQLPALLAEDDLAQLQQARDTLIEAGVPAVLADRLATLPYLYRGLEIVQLAHSSGQDSLATAGIYFALEQLLALKPLRRCIAALPERDLWQRKARAALAQEVDAAQIQACRLILGSTDAAALPTARLAQWREQAAQLLDNLQQTFSEVRFNETPNLAMLSVAVRELGSLKHP